MNRTNGGDGLGLSLAPERTKVSRNWNIPEAHRGLCPEGIGFVLWLG